MDWKQRIRSALTHAARVPDDDVVEELAQHAHAMYESARADGSSRFDAERRVELQIAIWAGDSAVLTRQARSESIALSPPRAPTSAFPWAGLLNDLRYAGRIFRRQAGFTLLAVSTMALGIGVTTMLFSVTYGLLMKPLPWPDSNRLVLLSETRGGNRPRFGSFSSATYLAWRQDATTIEDVAAWSPRTVTLAGAGDPERIRVTAVTASLFSVLRTSPLIGRLFEERDEFLHGSSVIVLSESLWRERFGSDTAVLGKIVQLDGQPHSIVGILEDQSAYPDRQSRAWVPFRVNPSTASSLSIFDAIARLRPNATLAQTAAEGTARGGAMANTSGMQMTLRAIFGDDGPVQVSVLPLRDALTSDVRQPLIVLLVAVGLLFLTATANVASLQLARATTRQRELAIRVALGAGSGRITRQLLIESLFLGVTGGLGGLVLAALLHRTVPSVLPADFPRFAHLGLDTIVVGFALAVSMLASLICGLVPALRARQLNLVDSLSQDGAAAVGMARWSRTARARLLVMVGQVAIACILLVGASLLGRSFLALLTEDRGYNPSGVLTARLSLPAPAYTPERRLAILQRVLDRLAEMPSVTDAAFTSELPLTAGGSTAAFTLSSREAAGGIVTAQASPRIVGPRAFRALGMRINAGRGFADSDTETSLPVVVVNQAFARRYLGDSPLGARLPMGLGYQDERVDATVIGIVDDVKYLRATVSSLPEMYYSYRQFTGRLPVSVVTLLVRTEGDPAALGPSVRMAIREADDRLVPDAVLTMEDRLLTSLARPRLYALLLGGFAAAALVIVAVGLFGVLSYTVAQRSRELAVRIALGARAADIIRLVVSQGLSVTAIGLAAGLTGSFALTGAMATLLYGVSRHDALTYLVVPVVLLLVAVAACIAPARRATRLDPLRLLKAG